MKRFVTLLFGLGLSLSAFAQAGATQSATVQQTIDALAVKAPLQGTVWGFCVKDLQGHTLTQHNAGQRMMPASNRKLITTGVALHAFGPEYRFRTGIGYTGEIAEDGTLQGDVYLIGGGDPTLGAPDSIAYKPDALFWKWKSLLKEAGIQRIHGRIVGDGTAFEGHLEHASWEYDDMGTYYGTGGNALCFYENAIDFDVAAAVEGEPVKMRQTYPETPWLHLTNHAFTGPEGTGNSLYLFTTDLAPYAELRGTFATDRKPKRESFSNKYGALTCAYYFWKNLRDTGWEVTGGYADIDRNGYLRGPDFRPQEKAGKPREIGFTESPRLADIAHVTNWRSDNFYAETFLRAMGEAASGVAEYDSCLVAESVVLRDLGLNLDDIALADGSGLSRMNYVTPEWMTDFLLAMRGSPAFDVFLSTIPHPGQGTLNVINLDPSRICMKSGSLGGTLCYSGYVLDASGRPQKVFSFLTNNAVASTREVRSAIVQVLSLLIE